MRKARARALLAIVVVGTLVLVACGADSLASASQTLDQVGKIAVSAQALIIGLNKSGGLTDAETRPIMDGFIRVGQVGLSAVVVLKSLKAQPETSDTKAQAAAALKAVQDAVSDITVLSAVGIKNPSSQQQVQQLVGSLVKLTGTLVQQFADYFGETPSQVLGQQEVALADAR